MSERTMSVKKSDLRILDAAQEIWNLNAQNAGALGYSHSIHANLYLPRSATRELVYRRSNGNSAVSIHAGDLYNPQSGKMVQQSLPYGGKPRALLAYIQTQAIINKSIEVPIGQSFTEFVKFMSGSATGGKNGSVNLWKKQLNALAAARIQYAVSWDAKHATQKNLDLIDEMELWLSEDPKQLTLWPEVVVLNKKYFDSLQEHALPIDIRALKVLGGNTLSFDLYMWLAYRLYRIPENKPLFLSWDILRMQFDPEAKNTRMFNVKLKESLKRVQALYQDMKCSVTDEGMIFRNSPPPVSSHDRHLLMPVKSLNK